jgi:hypothetical protein
MMSAYRELQCGELDTTDLDKHLEACAACRKVLASYALVGEQMRSAPALPPSQDMHERLMQALADEQLKMLQKSAPGEVFTPLFLKPYLQKRAQETQKPNNIAVFSTAETGPLPHLTSRRKRRQVPMNQYGVLGLVATVLFLFMIGGLSSLLILARNNPASISRTTDKVNRPTEINQKIYTTETLYPNVTSTIPAGNMVYYTAYRSDTTTGRQYWMLLQFDPETQVSQPLLNAPSSEPLVVLTASDNWLVWIQYDLPKTLKNENFTSTGNASHLSALRSWSLHSLALGEIPTASSTGSLSVPSAIRGSVVPSTNARTPASVVLTQGVFDSDTAPTWVTTPIQGTSLFGNTLLVTQVDRQGVSQLISYQLGQTGKAGRGVMIASAESGHILNWPTENDLGTQLYWADEWIAPDGTQHSNIWLQQSSEHPVSKHGYTVEQTTNVQSLFLADGLSFEPQVVDNTLFFLSTSEMTVSNQGTVVPTGVPLPASATNPSSIALAPRVDPAIYGVSPDASIYGTVVTIALDGQNMGVENTIGVVGQSTDLQAGNDYVLWQDSTGYRMYDALGQTYVSLGDTLSSVSLLVVNGDTTLWLADGNGTNGVDIATDELTMMAFTWPN